MIMEVKRIFVDPQVLIYTTDVASPWREIATKALKKARELEFELILSHQVLLKYLEITTTPEIAGNISLPKIIGSVKSFLTDFTVIGGKQEVLYKLLELMQEVPIAEKQVYNANIVATMLVYKIEHFLTHQDAAFEPFSEKIHIISFEDWVASMNHAD